MEAFLHTSQKAQRVVLLAEEEGALRTEENTLKSLEVSSLFAFTRGKEFLSYLADASIRNESPDIILCGEIFQKKSICFFLKEFSQDEKNAKIPVLLVSSSPEGMQRGERMGINAIARPYSQDFFRTILSRSMSVTTPLSHERINAYCDFLKELEASRMRKDLPKNKSLKITSDYLKEGRKKLHAKDYSSAEKEFLKALSRQPDTPDAYLNLARINRQKGDRVKAGEYLIRATASCLRTGQQAHAESIQEFLPDMVKKDGIFYHEALVFLKKKDYRGAVASFLEHCQERPELPFHAVIARACLRTPNPEENLDKLCDALSATGQKKRASKLRSRLFFEGGDYPIRGKSSWLESYPRLKEVLDIASHTMSLWRQA